MSRLTHRSPLGPDGIPDGNPEVLIIGSPLDGTKNPSTVLGGKLSDITGVVSYQYEHLLISPVSLLIHLKIWLLLRPPIDRPYHQI